MFIIIIEDVIKFREKTTLNDIINYTKMHLIDFFEAKDYYYVYCKEDRLDNSLVYYLDEGPFITDDNIEIYPEFVVKNNLKFIVDSEIVSLVIEAYLVVRKTLIIKI